MARRRNPISSGARAILWMPRLRSTLAAAALLAAGGAAPASAGADDPPPLFGSAQPPLSQLKTSDAADGSIAGSRALVRAEAVLAGLPPDVADAVAQVESGYHVNAVGAAGEVGLMQVMPATARMLGFLGSDADLAKPEVNAYYGVTYLAQAWRLAGGDICTATMKYRAGHGETGFSYKSVDYCLSVRAKLTALGFPVTGTVPKPTFGGPSLGSTGRRRLNYVGHVPNIDAINRRLQALSSAASFHSVVAVVWR